MKRFVSDNVHDQVIVDVVFEAAQGAVRATKEFGDDAVVNGAFGTYFKDEGGLLTFETVYRAFDKVEDVQKARYAAGIEGSPEFREAVKDWLFASENIDIDCDIVATPGGTGALSSTVKNALGPGDTVIHPDIGWGPYKTIARQHNVEVANYKLFDGDRFNIASFKDTCRDVMERQGKVLAFVNDPCQNPTGYTMKDEEWDELVAFVNELSEEGPVILLQDVAYIDFTLQGPAYRKHFERFKDLTENVLVVIAFSVSKTLTAYGMRVGAQVLISKNEEERTRFKNAASNTARGIWSTVNNGGMRVFSEIALDDAVKKAYLAEKDVFVRLLSERAEIFKKEAEAVDLPIYPYEEGFFITLRIDDAAVKNALHLALKKKNIFFVNVYGGLRIAICSIPKHKLHGLAKRIKETLDEVEKSRE